MSVRALLLEVTLEVVPPREPVSFLEIYWRVLDDYGPVSRRHVHRAVAALVRERRLRRMGRLRCGVYALPLPVPKVPTRRTA